jgi:WD40 repeat protein
VTSDGRFLAIGSRDNRVVVFDMSSGRKVQTLKFKLSAQSVHWSPNDFHLAIGLANADNSPTKVVDVATKKELLEVPGMRASWSPDGRILATGGGDGVVRMFTDTGRPLGQLPGHGRYVHKIAWRPNGRQFATASVDNFVMIWDATNFQRVSRFSSDFALSLAWSPDGRMLASGGGEQFVTVWEADSRRELFKITSSSTITGQVISGTGAAGYVLDVAWYAEGKTLLVSDRQGGLLVYSARLFESDTDDGWLATAREQLQQDLSEEERRRYGLQAVNVAG